MLKKSLFVFDIETVPDLVSAQNLLGVSDSPEAMRDKLVSYHLEITGGKNSFFRQPFHKVIAISFLEAEIEYLDDSEVYHLKHIRTGGKPDSSEEEIIKGFFTHLSKITPRLVSFNGKTFDLPVLKYRAMLHGVQAKWLHKGGDKWNNYNSKYSLDWHCDLLDALSDYGSSARIKMNEVCAMLGFPGKMGIDGSMVETMYNEGKINEIRDYCELDVLNTYLVYLRYNYHTGTISKDSYNYSITELLEILQAQAQQRAHFAEFLSEWSILAPNFSMI